MYANIDMIIRKTGNLPRQQEDSALDSGFVELCEKLSFTSTAEAEGHGTEMNLHLATAGWLEKRGELHLFLL